MAGVGKREDWLWLTDKKPDAPGIYPVLFCWDANEGHFPRSGYWDGTEWYEVHGGIKPRVVVAFRNTTHTTHASAQREAYEYDLEVDWDE